MYIYIFGEFLLPLGFQWPSAACLDGSWSCGRATIAAVVEESRHIDGTTKKDGAERHRNARGVSTET